MDIRFHIQDEIIPDNFTLENVDYSKLSYKLVLDQEKMIYRCKLDGTIKIWGSDFDYFLSWKQNGFLTVGGKFDINNSVPFGDNTSNIEYKLDAKTWNITDRTVELGIIAKDNYYKYDTKEKVKINIFDFDIPKRVLHCNKNRKKLWFYTTNVTGSSLWWTYSFMKFYAREEIKDATESEIIILNGVKGWTLDGDDLVRDWAYSGDFPALDIDTHILAVQTFSMSPFPSLNTQGHLVVQTGLFYNFIETTEFLDDYTLLFAKIIFTPHYSYYLLKNADYYGAKNDYLYFTVKNAISLHTILEKLHQKIYSTITIPFGYWTDYVCDLFDRDPSKNEYLYLQHLSEIVIAKNRTEQIANGQIEPATIGYMKLSDINQYLKDFWNVYWYKNGTQIIYKHYSILFDNYVSQNDITISTVGDLTPLEIVEFNTEEKFNRIEFNMSEYANNIDFLGMDIDFPNVKNENIKSVESQFFYSDIQDILANDNYPSNSKDSWLFAFANHISADKNLIVSSEQILKDGNYPNEKMSVAWVSENLAVGSDSEATINGQDKTIPVFEYETLMTFDIPPETILNIQPRNYFKTNFSETHILKEISLNLQNFKSEMTLFYKI